MKHSLNNTVKIKVVNMIFLGVHPRTTILFLAIKPTKHSVKSFSVKSVNINVSQRLNILCIKSLILYIMLLIHVYVMVGHFARTWKTLSLPYHFAKRGK